MNTCVHSDIGWPLGAVTDALSRRTMSSCWADAVVIIHLVTISTGCQVTTLHTVDNLPSQESLAPRSLGQINHDQPEMVDVDQDRMPGLTVVDGTRQHTPPRPIEHPPHHRRVHIRMVDRMHQRRPATSAAREKPCPQRADSLLPMRSLDHADTPIPPKAEFAIMPRASSAEQPRTTTTA